MIFLCTNIVQIRKTILHLLSTKIPIQPDFIIKNKQWVEESFCVREIMRN